MTVSSAYRNTANQATEGVNARDVSDIIYHVGEPTEAPLITLTGGKLYLDGENSPQEVKGVVKREIADAVKYEVIEKDPLARTVTVNGAVADTTTTTVTLDANGNLRVGDVIYNKESGEVCLVTAVDSGGADITVKRNLGSTSFTVADNSTFVVVGCAFSQGAAKASLKSQLAAPRERYCQIQKRSYGVTDTALNAMLETKQVDQWDEEATQALVEHKKDLEFSFWMNPQADSTTDAGSNTVYMTRGIIGELKANSRSITAESAISEDEFFGTISENIFQYGPRRKTLFVDAKFKSMLNRWERTKLMSKNGENRFGINVQELETGHGILEIVMCGVFTKFYPATKAGFAVALDLDRVCYKYIKNRDTKFEDMIQTPGTDAREAQYLTEAGVSLRSLYHHYVIENATA